MLYFWSVGKVFSESFVNVPEEENWVDIEDDDLGFYDDDDGDDENCE